MIARSVVAHGYEPQRRAVVGDPRAMTTLLTASLSLCFSFSPVCVMSAVDVVRFIYRHLRDEICLQTLVRCLFPLCNTIPPKMILYIVNIINFRGKNVYL